MKKNIYLVQVGFPFDNSVYLPYAAGTLAAAAMNDEYVKENYSFPSLLFLRESIDDALNRIKSPALVGFSCYVWNFEYNKHLARAIKERYPDCVILFGGHNVAPDGAVLREEAYIDILICGEGEIPFTQLLKNDLNPEKSAGCIYRDRNGDIISSSAAPVCTLDTLPSPYLSGMFDKIMAENPTLDFLSVIETNRGCPYNCSYCDWCSGKKLRMFPMEKVLAELKWLSDNKIEYCFCADSNFGMLERDEKIVDALLELNIKTGYPKVFRPCYAKDNEDRVFNICRKLNSRRMDKGATFAYQTLNDTALANVNRRNLNLEHFSGLMKRYNHEKIPSYSELILGLPGETYDSFCDGMCRLLDAGQHRSLSVYHCEMLVNSEMGTAEYIKKHGIEVLKVAFNHMHSAPEQVNTVKEYSNLIVATNTMSREMWVKSNLFSVCVQCFHNLGLLQCFALYLHFSRGVSYRDFYQGLLDDILSRPDTIAGKIFTLFEQRFKSELSGEWNYYDRRFGNVTWLFEEGAFLELLYNEERFRSETAEFLKSFGMDEEIFAELSAYQSAVLKKPGKKPFKLHLQLDWQEFFAEAYEGSAVAPEKKPCTVRFLSDCSDLSWSEFAKTTVWFGRRRGATLYTNDKNAFEIQYD